MTSVSYAVTDSATMLRRNLRHFIRYPSLTLFIVGMPIVFLLLFVYVLGETLGAGLGGVTSGRADYVNYLTPGLLLITLSGAAQGTAISVATDMTTGMIARFKTMPLFRAAVLTGHVLGSMIQSLLCVCVVLAAAVGVGFRSTATLVEWIAAFGVLALGAVALTWLTVALGLAAKSIETASNSPTILVLLPFFGSGFVPTESMPTALRWFADYQPFTPLIETLRGLLLGSAIGNHAAIAIGWSVAVTVLSYQWSVRLFARRLPS